jgi:hypothetical protein
MIRLDVERTILPGPGRWRVDRGHRAAAARGRPERTAGSGSVLRSVGGWRPGYDSRPLVQNSESLIFSALIAAVTHHLLPPAAVSSGSAMVSTTSSAPTSTRKQVPGAQIAASEPRLAERCRVTGRAFDDRQAGGAVKCLRQRLARSALTALRPHRAACRSAPAAGARAQARLPRRVHMEREGPQVPAPSRERRGRSFVLAIRSSEEDRSCAPH